MDLEGLKQKLSNLNGQVISKGRLSKLIEDMTEEAAIQGPYFIVFRGKDYVGYIQLQGILDELLLSVHPLSPKKTMVKDIVIKLTDNYTWAKWLAYQLDGVVKCDLGTIIAYKGGVMLVNNFSPYFLNANVDLLLHSDRYKVIAKIDENVFARFQPTWLY